MIDIVDIIINEFNEQEQDDDNLRQKLSRTIYNNKDKYDQLMKQKLSMDEYRLFLKHDDEMVDYWVERERRIVAFVLEFMQTFFLKDYGKKKK